MQKHLFRQFFKQMRFADFQVRYWDGTTDRFGLEKPDFEVIFHRKIPFGKVMKTPSVSLGEAYMDGTLDIRGDMDEVLRMIQYNKSTMVPKVISPLSRLASMSKQKEDVQYHYDLGNDFYSLWLDETMSYSCAYFQSPDDTLEKAQLQKIDHVLKKLQLNPGETLLDIGSGWGWLIIRAAQQFGVKATGITLSEEQFRKTKERIGELGLHNQVEVYLLDYRELAKSGRTFDKISSVGMFEHVGREQFTIFMQSIRSLLKERGVVLLHTITGPVEEPTNPWITKYIFPGGYIPSLREIIGLLPDHDFHTIDVESLRLHYAQTLDHWSDRFEHNIEQIREKHGERFIRMWRLYLRSCAASFRVSGLNLHQILFSKGLNNDLFMTREHLYR
jgi:cyclopropane-fatty-acyl-phospholipid synthase